MTSTCAVCYACVGVQSPRDKPQCGADCRGQKVEPACGFIQYSSISACVILLFIEVDGTLMELILGGKGNAFIGVSQMAL